jgi:hypothetical protein
MRVSDVLMLIVSASRLRPVNSGLIAGPYARILFASQYISHEQKGLPGINSIIRAHSTRRLGVGFCLQVRIQRRFCNNTNTFYSIDCPIHTDIN